MRYYEAKVLVPDFSAEGRARFEELLLERYGGFHVGPAVRGSTDEWGEETMKPYYVAFRASDQTLPETAAYELGSRLADLVKDRFGETAVYVAVTQLAGPFIR